MRLLILFLFSIVASAQDRIVLQTSVLFDGKGAVLKNQQIVIEDGRIVSVGPGSAKADYDLTGLTVMPGWIDTHVHLQWHMDANHKSVSGGVKPEEMALYTAADAWMEFEAGFTTVQSVGSTFDGPARDVIRQGVLPGPRVLTSLIQIQGMGGEGEKRHAWTDDELGEIVRKNKADGADVIKLFATSGLGAGGGQSMTDEQIQTVCSEAKTLGLRSVVHAIGDAGARAAVLAGCTSIEHGTFLKDETLDLMVKHGTFFDPNLLVPAQLPGQSRELYVYAGAAEDPAGWDCAYDRCAEAGPSTGSEDCVWHRCGGRGARTQCGGVRLYRAGRRGEADGCDC
jgi:imidazolonepropionase-like amidohydrolase